MRISDMELDEVQMELDEVQKGCEAVQALMMPYNHSLTDVERDMREAIKKLSASVSTIVWMLKNAD
jgi:hypothetical protein